MPKSLLRARAVALLAALAFAYLLLLTGCGGGATQGNPGSSGGSGSNPPAAPTATLTANPSTIKPGQSSTLSWSMTNASSAQIDNGIGAVQVPSGSTIVTPAQTTTYTLTVTGAGGTATANATVTVTGSLSGLSHVVFMLQENRTFDTYFGMLNPYREANGYNVGDDGKTYSVDGIDDKLSRFVNYDDEGQPF